MRHLRGLFVLDRDAFDLIYGPEHFEAISRRVEIVAPPQTADSLRANLSLLADVDVLFSGWGAPVVDEAFLDAAPRLRTIFYAAGAISGWMTEVAWDRQIAVTTAADANSIPVAEYSLATILFSLKHGWSLARRTRNTCNYPDRNQSPGAYRSTVGLISLGATGRKLLDLLKGIAVRLIAYDPFVSSNDAANLGVEMVSLDELFARSDVASLHTPELPETRGMITGRLIASMKPGATFINTARGSIVHEDEMLAVLAARPDLTAVLDTVITEPPVAHSPLYALPNVVLTPHIAGSAGPECRRMGQYMVDELDRYLHNQPLRWMVRRDALKHTAHRPAHSGRSPVTVTVNDAAVQQKRQPGTVVGAG